MNTINTHGLPVVLFVAVLVVARVGVLLEVLAENVDLRLRVTRVLIGLVALGSSRGRSHKAGNDELRKRGYLMLFHKRDNWYLTMQHAGNI